MQFRDTITRSQFAPVAWVAEIFVVVHTNENADQETYHARLDAVVTAVQ
jgi:hypothetical protein